MPEAGRHRAYLESPGLDAAGVHEVLDGVLEAKAAAAEGPGQHRELLPRHGERVLDHQIKRGDERGDRCPELVGDLHEELLFEPKELGLCGDVADRVQCPPSGERCAHELEHAHAILAREPGAAHEMSLGVLDLRCARHEQELLEDLADQRVLTEHTERGGIRARDVALAVRENDAVGERHERLREGRLVERRVLASLDLVVEDALTMPRQELSVLAGTLRRSGLRLEHLVENLMDAGSIEAGTFQVRAMPASLRHSLSEALAFVHPMLESKAQELVTDMAPDADRVLADERRTTQVFANLISNASKYAPEGTKVTVRTVTSDGFVRITIADEGPGIPLDEQNRLFQRFFRSRTVREQAG